MTGLAPILVVDDRVENLVAVEAVLQPLGHPLVRALSGEEALRHVFAAAGNGHCEECEGESFGHDDPHR